MQEATRTPASKRQFVCYLNIARRTHVPAGNGQTVALEQKLITHLNRADLKALFEARLREAKATIADREQRIAAHV